MKTLNLIVLGCAVLSLSACRKDTPDGKVPQMRIWHYVLEKKAATEEVPGSRVVVWFDNSGKLNAVTVHGAPDIEATVSRRAGRCD